MEITSLTRAVLESRPGSGKFQACAQGLGAAALSADRARAKDATRAIFADIVEPWCDSFDPDLVDSYVWFMSEVIYAERSPIAARLKGMGFAGPEALRERYWKIRKGVADADLPNGRSGVRQVVVLSRVTIGADIAVTSVLMRTAHLGFRNCSMDFVAPRKNALLLANGRSIGRLPTAYTRGGLLWDRLRAWTRARKLVQQSIHGLDPGEWVVIDPDSRYTQLGLLPVCDDRYYELFESRALLPGDSRCLGELAGDGWWADFIDDEFRFPYVRTSGGGNMRSLALRWKSRRPLAAVSFGYGGRDSKRLGGAFEDALLELLRKLGYRTVLDYGHGDEEERIADARVAAYAGSTCRLRRPSNPQYAKFDLLTFQGSLSVLGQWIQDLDVFVGYDSAAAHLAAAHGLPVIQISAGAPNKLFRQRWKPFGYSGSRVVAADGPGDGPEVLRQVERLLVACKEQGGRGGRWDLTEEE